MDKGVLSAGGSAEARRRHRKPTLSVPVGPTARLNENSQKQLEGFDTVSLKRLLQAENFTIKLGEYAVRGIFAATLGSMTATSLSPE